MNLLGDYHPWAGGWRITGGVYDTSYKLSGNGQFNGAGTITINGHTYNSSGLSSLDVSAKWNGAHLYIGFGYDGFSEQEKNGGLFFNFDMGVIFSGKPSVDLIANCTNTSLCAQINADVASERAKIEQDLKNAKYLPVVQVGIGYRF